MRDGKFALNSSSFRVKELVHHCIEFSGGIVKQVSALLLSAYLSLAGLCVESTPENQSVAVAGTASPTPAPVPAAATPAALPPYEFPWNNGLYASAAGYLSIKKVCLDCQRTYFVDVPGFCQRMPVKAVIQDNSAPLVVMLLGIEGRPDEDFYKLWQSWYAEAGYHVLTFDSTFIQEFNQRSQHGVTGNLWAETALAKEVIAAFIAQTCVKDRISKIGIVGMSYGAVEALMLGTLAAKKELPFEVSALQAFSPPVNMLSSAKIIDGWHAETYGKYTLVELQKLRKHVPCRDCPDSPIDECMLKSAAATSFRLPLPALIAYNDQNYCLHILPRGGEFDDAYVRQDHAARWTFVKFAFGMSYPYWQRKLNLSSLEELIRAGDLAALQAKQPAYSEIIMADDDPLNSPAEFQAFKAQAAGKRVTFLPRGGHLGYVSEGWTRAKLLTLFDAK